ncbi:helix-turn-helix domain-containing protein [Paenibacillus arenilitoris]|uniref:Helix-turn-helix domain-containing protein n=1 Tax=Paenibacillus arenilitoris TaxID=2772299 RepID=A0A927CKZ7_9BACL|nr:helix-turn-helix domain-containing protein [Paenibacillus arenilitoris]MBD2869112.1 helix-turn-helix domain-containing protein [Paenibacillus arenilitoris]
MWGKSFFRYAVYRKMLMYFVLIVALTVLAVSGTLYFMFASKTEQTIGKHVISMLQQTSYTSNVVQEQVGTIGSHLLNNHRIITVLMNKHLDRVQEHEAMNILTDIQSTYPFIKHLGIYNDNTKRYLSTAGTPYELNDKEKKQLTSMTELDYMSYFSQKLLPSYSMNTKAVENVITFILRPKYALTSSDKGAILIHVDEKYILKTIRSISSGSDNVFVMDSNGLVLSHTDPNQFMKRFDEQPYIQRILDYEGSSSHFKANIDDRNQLVTFVQSSQMNWYFVSIKPYDELIKDIAALRGYTMLVAIAILALGALTAYVATNKLYNPLGRLIGKVNDVTGRVYSDEKKNRNEFSLLSEAFTNVVDQAMTVETAQKQSFPVLKKTYLQHLLRGTHADLSSTHILNSAINKAFSSAYYMVVVAAIDCYEEFERKNDQTKQGLYRFSINNISSELLAKHAPNESIVVDERTMGILMLPEAPIDPDKLLLTLTEVQEVIRSYFHFTVSFGVGNLVTDRNDIQQSFASAYEYVKYRFFYGRQSVIQANLLQNKPYSSHAYPAQTEKKLIEALRLSHAEKIEQTLSQFIEQLQVMNYYQAFLCANQLLGSLHRHFEETLPIMQEHSKEYYTTVHALQHVETLEEVQSQLRKFCMLIQMLGEKKQPGRSDSMIDSVCAYLQEHYHNPDLGIETVAQMVQLSPGYLGKLFRSHTQTSFNDYLKNIRIEKAKKLLLSTNESVAVISEKVGIINTTYFFTLFKKTTGLSPTQFREQHENMN